MPTPRPSALARHWGLDPAITFLNHGSFGAAPTRVLEAQSRHRARMESEPVRFMVEELEGLLDRSRAALGEFVGADPHDIAFVPNATAGVNAVVRSLQFRPGDELLSTNHGYNACLNALRFASEASGARVVLADVPFPVRSSDEVYDAIMDRVTPRTRLAMICHITSPTALIFPIRRLVNDLQARGVDVLVDAAHAPGMLPVDIDSLGAAYYTANCHKWLCTPKGSAFLHVRKDRREAIRPNIISHGANSSRTDRSRFLLEFDWTGTIDFTPYICIADSLEIMASIGAELPRAAPDETPWDRIRRHNHELALSARRLLHDALGTSPAAPDDMIGCTATVRLPPGKGERPAAAPYFDPLQLGLLKQFQIQVPVSHFPAWPGRTIRVSAQLYNHVSQYEHLAAALRQLESPC